MGYSNALPTKNRTPYLPALGRFLVSSFIFSPRTVNSFIFSLKAVNSFICSFRTVNSFICSFSLAICSNIGMLCRGVIPEFPLTGAFSSSRKEASSRIEISAWSDLPLALAMASSFALRSGSSRIEYGGGRLSVFMPLIFQW